MGISNTLLLLAFATGVAPALALGLQAPRTLTGVLKAAAAGAWVDWSKT